VFGGGVTVGGNALGGNVGTVAGWGVYLGTAAGGNDGMKFGGGTETIFGIVFGCRLVGLGDDIGLLPDGGGGRALGGGVEAEGWFVDKLLTDGALISTGEAGARAAPAKALADVDLTIGGVPTRKLGEDIGGGGIVVGGGTDPRGGGVLLDGGKPIGRGAEPEGGGGTLDTDIALGATGEIVPAMGAPAFATE
jgi:hypothetical protein